MERGDGPPASTSAKAGSALAEVPRNSIARKPFSDLREFLFPKDRTIISRIASQQNPKDKNRGWVSRRRRARVIDFRLIGDDGRRHRDSRRHTWSRCSRQRGTTWRFPTTARASSPALSLYSTAARVPTQGAGNQNVELQGDIERRHPRWCWAAPCRRRHRRFPHLQPRASERVRLGLLTQWPAIAAALAKRSGRT